MSDTTADQGGDAGGLVDLTDDKGFFGHPKGLAVLFFAEMWERFSYYGMRALLVLYLTQHFLFGDAEAQGLYAAYASLVYLLPIVGGFIADRYLGARRAVMIGAVFLTAGHTMMAFEGEGSKQFIDFEDQRYEIVTEGRAENARSFIVASEGAEPTPITFSAEGITLRGEAAGLPSVIPAGGYEVVVERQPGYVGILFLALSLIIVGVGFLKANISTIVGALYSETDPRRDPGFTIFYMGINLGSVLATALCGYLGIRYGWNWGFGLAGIGMALGLVTFVLGTPLLRGRGEPPIDLKAWMTAATWIAGVMALLPLWWLVQRDEIVSSVLSWTAPGLLIGLLAYSLVAFKAETRTRMLVALALTSFSVVFWALFEQAGSSMTLYAARNSSLEIFPGFSMTSAQTNLFNPAIIVVFAPIFAWLWVTLARSGKEPSTPLKFATGLALVGLGFLVLAFGASNFNYEVLGDDGGTRVLVPLIWLFLAYLLHTFGELCLSPVGLSMITKLSAARVVGLMMGFWFVSSAMAHTVAGWIAQLTAAETVGGVVTDSAGQLQTYISVFYQIGWIGLAIGGVVAVLSPIFRKGMAGIH